MTFKKEEIDELVAKRDLIIRVGGIHTNEGILELMKIEQEILDKLREAKDNINTTWKICQHSKIDTKEMFDLNEFVLKDISQKTNASILCLKGMDALLTARGYNRH